MSAMKTMKNLLFVAFAAMTVAACQKEFENLDNLVQNSANMVAFTGSLDDIDTQVKTTIWYENGLDEGKFTTYFMNGDHVMVNGVESGELTKTDENENGSTFKYEVAGVESPYYAVSAKHVAEKTEGEGEEVVTTPLYDAATHTYDINYSSSQKYRLAKSNTMTSYYSDADIFAAYSLEENICFKHLSTFLAITINKDNSTEQANIKNVYIRQGDGSNIAGRWYVKFDTDNMPYVEPGKLSNYITYGCVVSSISPDGVPQGKPMIIGVPSYNYQNGLLVTIEDMNGKFASFKISAEETQFALKGGVIIPFNPAFKPESRRTIKTADDWNEFAAHINATKGNAYQWVGGGVVVLENNIEAESLTQITADFKYVFDGNGKTITQTKATSSLFSNLTGEIRNLTLNGELNLSNAEDAPFVKNIHAGAKMTGCTNNMNVNFNIKTHCYVTGIAAVAVRCDTEGMESLEISDCTNNGSITGTVDVSSANYNVAVAGIIGDVRAGTGNVLYDVLLKNCTNNGEIKVSPKSGDDSTKGMSLCGVGGIVGYLRNSKSVTLDNCDNTKPITLSAENISSETGLKAGATAVGGIIGIGTNAASGLSLTGQKITLVNCDNSATIYNCAVNASAGTTSNNKVYTGGLAGALIGLEDSYAAITSCTNTGDVFTYDVCGANAATTSATSAVAGGFIGFGGYLNMTGCTVECQLGNGYRQSVAWGGVLGFAMRPFDLIDSTIDVVGYFNRIKDYNMNRAVIAVVPVKCGSTAMSPAPSTSKQSNISGTSVTCKMLTTSGYPTADLTDNLRENASYPFTSDPFKATGKVKSNLTCGVGSSANTVINIGEDNTFNYGTL